MLYLAINCRSVILLQLKVVFLSLETVQILFHMRITHSICAWDMFCVNLYLFFAKFVHHITGQHIEIFF